MNTSAQFTEIHGAVHQGQHVHEIAHILEHMLVPVVIEQACRYRHHTLRQFRGQKYYLRRRKIMECRMEIAHQNRS